MIKTLIPAAIISRHRILNKAIPMKKLIIIVNNHRKLKLWNKIIQKLKIKVNKIKMEQKKRKKKKITTIITLKQAVLVKIAKAPPWILCKRKLFSLP